MRIVLVDNPFDLFLKEVIRFTVPDGNTVRSSLELLFPGFVEFEHPTLCLVNGEPYMRSQWGDAIPDDSIISFVRLAQGWVEIIIAIVILIVAIVIALAVLPAQNQAAIGADDKTQANGETVYTLSGERNQVRLNNSIECAYGKNKMFPSYAAIPYTTYEGNDQYQYSLFSLGHGSFDVHQVFFEDTPLSRFSNVTWRKYSPGASVTMFPVNVFTTATVNNIELFGENQDEYKDWTPAYTVNEPGTQTNKIQVDLVLPAGLYTVDEEGEYADLEVKAEFEYRKINDAGTPVSGWNELLDFEKEMDTPTPQRFSYYKNVDLGRYQVRARRSNDKAEDTRSADILKWESMKCYFPTGRVFGDVTLIAVKARATNQLNNNSASRFNCLATRRLQQWSPVDGWAGGLIATRNPVWAFCDAFRASYGGRLATYFLDLESLYALSVYYETQGIWFDYIFDQGSTVWEVAKTIARVGRGVPMLSGSQITIIRDYPRRTATAVFNQHNIILGSFNWSIKLPTVAETNGIELEYMDSTTWLPETVLCLIGTDTGNNPEKMKLPGCTNRTRAFQEGLYQRATQLYNRESIEFKTGLEGHLPQFGDLILVTHDVPKWGNGGIVTDIDGTVVTLSNPVTFAVGLTHKIVLRKKDGSAYGPLTCTQGADAFKVVVDPEIEEAFHFDDIHERPCYLFGVENLESKRCTVVGIVPEGDDIVQIKAVAYDERVFSFASVETPAPYGNPRAVVLPALPVVTGLTVTQSPNSPDLITVTWTPALGALYYIVETSPNGFDWALAANPVIASVSLRVAGSYLYVRVSGVNVGIGPEAVWDGAINQLTVPGNVTGLKALYASPGSITVQWDVVPYADSYMVYVFSSVTGGLLRFEDVLTLYYTYTLAMGAVDGLSGRAITFRVRAKNIIGTSSLPAELGVTIPPIVDIPPDIPTNLLLDNSSITIDSSVATLDHT